MLDNDFDTLSAFGDLRGARADLRDLAQGPLRRRELSIAGVALRAVHQLLNRTPPFRLIHILRLVLLGDRSRGERDGSLVRTLR